MHWRSAAPRSASEKRDEIGSIKVPGCGFHNDSLFDPVVLLVTWTNNKPCFEKAMQAHAVRGDNRVVVSPRADYHGGQGGGIVDLWHDPATFRAFLVDIRRHVNNRSDEAYSQQWCRQALAIGGWGCGSASYRRP